MVTTSAPCPVKRARTSGERITRINSAFSLARIGAGVPPAASIPCQLPDSKPGTPCSAIVGTSPINGIRVRLDTPSTLSLPACTCGSVASIPFIRTWVVPATVSSTACTPPL